MTTHHQKSYALSLSILSPVHVATGQAMAPGDYLIANNMLYEFGRWGISRHLDPRQRKELLELLNKPGDNALPLRVQQFLAKEASHFMPFAERAVPLYPGITSYYQERLGKLTQPSSKTFNQLELMRHTGAEFGSPYIPGSSLKGAIRGALLNVLNNSNALNNLANSSSKPCQADPLKEEQRLLGYNNFADDPFRGLLVEDAVNQQAPAELDYLLVNRVNFKPDDHGEMKVAIGLAPVECLSALQNNALHLSIRLQHQAMDKTTNDKIKPYLADFHSLAKHVNGICQPQFEKELAWLEANNIASFLPATAGQSWTALMREMLANNKLRGQLDRGEAMLLRVGKHTGAISKTVSGWRHIKRIMQKKQPATYHSVVTTQCLALSENKQLTRGLPFGWVLLRLKEQEDTLSPLLATFSEAQQQARQEKRHLWQQEKQAAQERHQLIAAQKTANKERQAVESTHALRLDEERARMTLTERTLVELADTLAVEQCQQRCEPQGMLRQQLNKAVELIAIQGNADEKHQLRCLFQQICQHWKIPFKENKKLKELWGRLA